MTKILSCLIRNKVAILCAAIMLLFSGVVKAQIITSLLPGLNYPNFEVPDSARNLYVSDGGQIRIISAAGIISDWIGSNSTSGYSGDGGPATAAMINGPQGMAFDAAGNFYFADQGNSCIRKVDASGIISTIAGTGGASGFSGDFGPASQAQLSDPSCIVLDKNGNLFISDQHNNRIRKVNTAGIITTIAGIDSAGFSGDGGSATNAAINQPVGIAVDTAGNIFFADSYNSRVRKINAAGIISTIAGCDTGVDYGDNIAATTELLSEPMGITTDNFGNVFIADQGHNQVRKVDQAGIIKNVAGFGIQGFSGDGGPAIYAFLAAPNDVKTDAAGDMYIVDQFNFRIRYIANTLAAPVVDVASSDIIVYPNPGNGLFTIKRSSGDTEPLLIRILNAIGQVVYEQDMESSTLQIDLKSAPNGIYFVMITGRCGAVPETRKLVKQ